MKQKITWIFLTYIKLAAKLQLLKNRPKVIGITGSAGKTSTQHAVVAALLPEFKLKYSYNANSETGLPLSILGIKPKNFSIKDWLRIAVQTIWKLLTNWERYEVLVVEMGIDSPLPPKNMAYLLTIVQPDIGIMLNAAPMHSQPFDFLVSETDATKRRAQLTQLIAEEKGRIVTDLSSTATAVLNTDQKELRNLLTNISAQVVSFGKNKDAVIKILSSKPSLKGTEFHFEVAGEMFKLFIKDYALAQHYGYTFAAALATAQSLRVPIKKALTNLETFFSVEPGRSTLIEGKNGVTILDSSYNSSTKPTVEMLEMLPKLGAKRCIALLGDIREIGSMTQIEHETVAHAAVKNCDAIFLVGPQMKQYALPIIQKSKKPTQWFESAVKATQYLESYLQPDDLILIKSSQNTLLLEIVVEQLMLHPQLANELLCRRGEYWNQRRKAVL